MMKTPAILLTVSTALAALHVGEKRAPSLGLYIALQSTGILEIAFDPTLQVENSLSISGYTTNAGYKPGWVTSHQDRLYSISRTYFPNENSLSGGLFAFELLTAPSSGATNLTLINKVSSNGLGGVHCDVSPDGTVLSAANIDGSSVATYSLSSDGTIGDLSHVFHYNLTSPGPGSNESQIVANPHQAVFDPSGHFMIVPDRGSDRLYVYSVNRPNHIQQIQNITLPPGTGPRHAIFKQVNATRSYMYLIGELDNTIRVFTLDHNQGLAWKVGPHSTDLQARTPKLTLHQTISTLGANHTRTAPNNHDLAAEAAVTNDGGFLYASNRNTLSLESDTLAIYAVNDNFTQAANTDHLTYLGFNETLGKIPRHFALSNDDKNRWLAVANEVTQDIVVFERDLESGFMKSVAGRLVLGELDLQQEDGPMCVLWK